MADKEKKHIYSNEEVFDKGELYNFENEQARLDKMDKKAKEKNSLPDAYFDAENIVDENAEKDMIRRADEAIRREREQKSETDPFEYSQTLIRLHEDASASEKDDILNKITIFTEGYKKILDKVGVDLDKQELETKKLFDKTFGKLIYGYNSETGDHTLGAHKPGYVRVVDKKAPVDAYRPQYDNKGAAVDPNEIPDNKNTGEKRVKKGGPKTKRIAKKISDIFTNGKKFPFRGPNRK